MLVKLNRRHLFVLKISGIRVLPQLAWKVYSFSRLTNGKISVSERISNREILVYGIIIQPIIRLDTRHD